LHNFIAYLHHQLKREIGFFDCDHRSVKVLSVALQNAGDLLFGPGLQLFNLANGAFQGMEEIRLPIGRLVNLQLYAAPIDLGRPDIVLLTAVFLPRHSHR
jgi:hypothetical protein